jgi:DNA end-binding protein Ku
MPQAIWTGHLRLSLVTIPVRLFSATAGTRRLTLHQIHEPSGKRIRYQKVAPGVGPVDTDEIVKGYEYTRGKYVLLSDKEIDELKLESKQTIELVRFVDYDGVDPRYCDKPYYVLPDGDAAGESYVTLQRALKSSRKIGIGHFVLRGKSVLAAVRPCGKGLLLESLRYQHEVKKADEFFRSVPEVKVDKEALSLAEELIDRKEGQFEPDKFKDDFYEAMRELIDAKIEDREPVVIEEPRPTAKIINLKDALRRSVKEREGGKASGTTKRGNTRRKRKSSRSTSRKKSGKARSAAKRKSA